MQCHGVKSLKSVLLENREYYVGLQKTEKNIHYYKLVTIECEQLILMIIIVINIQ